MVPIRGREMLWAQCPCLPCSTEGWRKVFLTTVFGYHIFEWQRAREEEKTWSLPKSIDLDKTSPLSGKESNQSFPYPTLRSTRLCGKETRNPRETESWEKTDSIDISLFHIHAYLWWWVLPPLPPPFLLSLRVLSLLVSKIVVLSILDIGKKWASFQETATPRFDQPFCVGRWTFRLRVRSGSCYHGLVLKRASAFLWNKEVYNSGDGCIEVPACENARHSVAPEFGDGSFVFKIGVFRV